MAKPPNYKAGARRSSTSVKKNLLRTGLLQTIFHHLSFVVAIASWFSLA